MKTILNYFLLVGVLSLTANVKAQIPTQNFSWTVTGTGTETWFTATTNYISVTATIQGYHPNPPWDTESITAGVSGLGTYHAHLDPPTDFGFWVTTSLSVGSITIFNDIVGNTNDPETFDRTFNASANTLYTVEAYDADFTGGSTVTVTVPQSIDEWSHTATRSGTATGNNSVSVSDGQKNLWGFAPSAAPQPQAGGTMSGITYSITCNNPNVVLVFSDTGTTTTTYPGAYIYASVAPPPSQVIGMSMASNTVAKNGTATMVWNWTATPYTAGYQVVFDQYINGTWQTPTTNYTSANTYTFIGILPGAPCEFYMYATNVMGVGLASVTNWPYAATVPLPAQVTGLGHSYNMAVSTNSTTMVWNWSAANYAAGYRVVFNQYTNGTWQTPVTNYTSATNYTVTGIIPGTPCEFFVAGTNVNEVSLTNVIGIGPVSLTDWPFAAAVPEIPGYILMTANYAVTAGDAVMGFSWSATTNAPIVGYQTMFAHYVNGIWPLPTTNFTTQTGISFTNLMPGDPYEFYVVPVNGAGVGLASDISWPFAAPHIPGSITSLRTSTNRAGSPTSATIGCAWTPAAGISGFESTYEAIMSQYVNGTWQPLTTNYTSGTNFIYTGIAPGTPFEFYVVATNNAGAGPASATNWPFAAFYTPPTNTISLQAVSGGKMRLSLLGNVGAKYALERSFSLVPPNWVPLVTNVADGSGTVLFTNTPVSTTNNFWRIRSVP